MKIWTEEETRPHQRPFWEAIVLGHVDGDTFDLSVKVGLDTRRDLRIRLIGEEGMSNPRIGVDAWETRGPERLQGKAAAKRVQDVLPVGMTVRIWSKKGGSQGSMNRWLCAVFLEVTEGNWISLGDLLIKEGHAELWWKGKDKGRERPSL